MNLSEQIRQAREAKGLSQEALAEQLGLSRQAVSKWELGASCPSPENLEALGNILEADFSGSSALEPPEAPKKRRLWLWGLVLLSCALLAFLFSAPEPAALITAVRFYDETGAQLHPDLGDGWWAFETPEQGSQPVTMVVSFQNSRRADVNAVSLFYTPAGTETFDQREQWCVQAVEDGLDYALFVLRLQRDLMGHLEIRLECTGGAEVSEILNVTAAFP